MTIFNPQVPQGKDDMPNWLKSAGSPISDLVADKSAGLALQTAATGIEGANDIGKQVVNDVISEDVRKTVEPIRNDFTKELELARNAQQGGVIPAPVQTAGGANAGGDLYMGQPQQSVPDAIQSGLDKVQALQSAMANGKINDTYYDLRLKDAVTGLRSKYPGFVDTIDQKVSAITGINPANAYISNLMQDINRSQTNKKTAVDTAVDTAMKSGYPDSDIWVKNLQTQGDTALPKFRQWYSEQTMLDSQIKRKAALRADTNATKEDITTQRTSDWTNETGAAISGSLSTLTKISGLDQPKPILDLVQDAANNPDKYNEAQMKQLGTQVLAKQAVMEQQLNLRMNQTSKDSQGRTYSYASDIGAEKAQNIIKNQVAIYGTIGKALTDGNVGLAFYAANHAKAILDQSKDNLLTDDSTGGWAAKMSTFNDTMGPNWTNLVTSQALRNNIDDKMRGYLDNSQLDARLGTNSITMKQHLEDADKLQQQGKINANQKGRYIGNLVNVVDDIKNKDAPDTDKINVLKYIFSPEGQGILNHIKTDYTDPLTNKQVPGKYSVFTRLTSDDVVKEVSRLSKSDPSVGKMYKNYLENEAGSQLFYKEMQNLNQFTGHDDLHFAYNTGDHDGIPQISLIAPRNTPVAGPGGTVQPPVSQGYLYQVQKIVNRVNEGLAGMARVENGLGGNANEYMLQFMQRSQIDLGKNWEGLPAKLQEAIAASRAPQRRIEDTFDNLRSK